MVIKENARSFFQINYTASEIFQHRGYGMKRSYKFSDLPYSQDFPQLLDVQRKRLKFHINIQQGLANFLNGL